MTRGCSRVSAVRDKASQLPEGHHPVSLTASRRTRRISSFSASLALLLGAFVVASPAEAAVGVDLSVNTTTITEGDSLTLSWTSTDAVDLVASGDWSGHKAIPSASEVVTPAKAGTYAYSLQATDVNGGQSSDQVTVTVQADGITPAAVTFPDPCTVVIPMTEHVTYFVSYGDGDDEEYDAGTYPAEEFYNGDDPVTFYAEADNGFAFAPGAVTRWEFTPSEDCFPDETTLVKATAKCGKITFTNVYTETVHVFYGSTKMARPDGEFDLKTGASRTVKTGRKVVLYVALDDSEEAFQIDSIDVPQGCGKGGSSDHPTVAPAAGSSDASGGGSSPALGLLAIMTAVAAFQLRRTVR